MTTYELDWRRDTHTQGWSFLDGKGRVWFLPMLDAVALSRCPEVGRFARAAAREGMGLAERWQAGWAAVSRLLRENYDLRDADVADIIGPEDSDAWRDAAHPDWLPMVNACEAMVEGIADADDLGRILAFARPGEN